MSNKKLKLVLLIAVIVLAVGLIIINNLRSKSGDQTGQSGLLIPTPVVLTAGSFNIAEEIKAEAATGQTKEIEIVANSDERPIVSYDLVIAYDPNSLEILAAESLIPDFKVYPLEKSNYFVITGVKDLESAEPTVFADQSIVKLKILPKRKTALNLKIAATMGKEKSQMVDTESKIIRPEVAEFTLEP